MALPIYIRSVRLFRLLIVMLGVVLLSLLPLSVVARTIQSPQATPKEEPKSTRQGVEGVSLAIESFAPIRAYVVGSESVTLVTTIRNTGKEPLPAGLVTARLSCLSGLDYTEGDTRPKLPALEPNATASFRWRVQPNSPQNPLLASLTLDMPGKSPDTRVLALQRFTDAPSAIGENPNTVKLPTARANGDQATLENATLRVRIGITAANVPTLFLSAYSLGTGWRKVGVSLPVAEVMSSEGGQAAWWEVFKADEVRAVNEKGEASLLISGGFGMRWRATVRLTLRLDSSILDGRLMLAPLKTVKLSGVRFMPLLVGDGSFGAAKDEQIVPDSSGQSRLTAVRWGSLTIGALWQEAPLFPNWQTTPLTNAEGADYRLLGIEMRTTTGAVALTPAGMVEARARWFVLTPSPSVEDARRIAPPKP